MGPCGRLRIRPAGLSGFTYALIIGALSFTFVMVLMTIALAKALYRSRQRDKETG